MIERNPRLQARYLSQISSSKRLLSNQQYILRQQKLDWLSPGNQSIKDRGFCLDGNLEGKAAWKSWVSIRVSTSLLVMLELQLAGNWMQVHKALWGSLSRGNWEVT
jgi:hypothetical protein